MDTPNDLMREEKGQKVSENHDWSKLCPDLLQNIIERLSFVDFYRAQIVCSDWYTVWKTCVKKTLYPWRILYDADSLMLFDPREDKNTRKLLGLSDDSYYMASFGNWLLMVDSRLDFYIFNLITCQRIDLPSMETPIHKRINISSRKSSSHDGHTVRFKRSNAPEYGEWGHFVEYGKCGQSAKPCRKDHVSKLIYGSQRSAVLWINEKTGDYVVAWIFKQHYLFTYKKGDESWWNWNSNWKPGQGLVNLGYLDLSYENSKLYLYTTDHHIKIIDFSGDFPKEDIENNPYRKSPFKYIRGVGEIIWKRRIAIQKSGEVLVILSLIEGGYNRKLLFYIFKMNLESGKWEREHSIGDDEMIIFGHGVTIRAPIQDVGDGIKTGSICFVKDDVGTGYVCASNCGVFDLATSEITWPNRVGVKTQWFVPGFV